jgi:hypothetical protein
MAAHLNQDGSVRLVHTVSEMVPVEVVIKVEVDGRVELRKAVEHRKVQKQVQVQLRGVQLYSPDGRKLDPRDVKLTGPTPVLVSSDGRPVDPFYTRLAREGTIIIVAPDWDPNLPAPRPKGEPFKDPAPK